MINVFVIDNHPLFIDGIRSVFNDRKDEIIVSGWATSVDKAFPKLIRSKAQVVLLDLFKPEYSGVELCMVIKDQFPDKKVIVLTGELNPNILYKTWMSKADAILMKYCRKSELSKTIHAVLAGDRVIGKKVPTFINMKQSDKPLQTKLTIGEQKVLDLLAKGHKREQVGEVLGISQNTIHFHCKNLFKKFNKHKLISVIEAARQEYLIS